MCSIIYTMFTQISKKQIYFLQNLIYNEKEKSYTIIGRGLCKRKLNTDRNYKFGKQH